MSDFLKRKEVEDNQPYILSDFELQNKIGYGGFGKVYKTLLKKTGKIYAAKISKERIEDPENEEILNISREVNIISKLNHPSVLKFIFYSPINFKKKPKPVIITEFATNSSLSDLIEKEKISPSGQFTDTLKLILIYGISTAMSYLHSHDILHRDLKPENILLDDYFFPKVGDFGLSKVNNFQSSQTQTSKSVIKGTVEYIAPEIWTDYKYSKSSDVYAFGMVVYEIITNKSIFENIKYNIMISYEVCNGNRPEIDSNVPVSYRSLIEKCWAQDPKNRPTFDEILNELVNDPGYLTESVNKKEFFNYVNYINI